jgi:hypothetical protein
VIVLRWRRVALVPAVLAATWLLAGCGKGSGASPAPTSSSTAPATAAPSTAGSVSAPATTSAPAGTAAEQQDLVQAENDIADLEKALSQVDSGLNANQQTEGDVNP